jgi:SHS2 domain-containing protein
MVDLEHVVPLVTREVTATASDRERLLVAWLAELIFLTETDGLVFSSFAVEIDQQGCSLRGRAHGEPLDEVRHDAAYDVKAVTYHDLEVAQDRAGWRCRVIVDV